MAPYDPIAAERDACGIGFVADASGRPSRRIIDLALDALCRVRHRGAVAADALTGDGAGVLLPLPHRLLVDETRAAGARPDADAVGAAMVFIDPDAVPACRALVARACAHEGIEIAAWRDVPVDPTALGPAAAERAPAIQQAILVAPPARAGDDLERAAFRARRAAEAAARDRSAKLYVASLSFRTIVYKALCAADQLAAFYPDLADDRCEAWFALFHQRYSTNTTPTWERAQPFRLLAHNGEINTIRGNAAWMRAREGGFGSNDLCPEENLRPSVDARGSDSGVLDEALELLVRGGRELTHAATMLVPPAWEATASAHSEERAFHRYHSCLMEPWDGPAALVMADGDRVAAALDRNGLRPLRVSICDDGLVACASEAGAVATRGHGRVRRDKLGPGRCIVVDPSRGGVVDDGAVKTALARRRPYREWVAAHLEERSSGEPVATWPDDLPSRQVAAGYTKEEMTVVLRPMAVDGHEPTSSMGDDTPSPPLARYARPVFAYLKQRFAQVTNPPIDHLRERHVMSLTTRLGRRGRLLEERPDAAALAEYESFFLFPDAVAALSAKGAARLDATFPVGDGADGLPSACERLADDAVAAIARGAAILVIDDAAMNAGRAPVPSALAAGAVHTRLLREGLRTGAGVVVVASDARETHHAACLLTTGADAICPRLALETIAHLSGRGRLGGDVSAARAQTSFRSALEDGVLKVMSKMGISALDSYRGAQIVEVIGLDHDVLELCFDGISSPLRGVSLRQLGEDALARHANGYADRPILPNNGVIKFKKGGELHGFEPSVIDALHRVVALKKDPPDPTEDHDHEMTEAHALRRAVRGDDDAYQRFSQLVHARPPVAPRDLLGTVAAGPPVRRAEVEPASEIARRFSTGAMSHGALSAEAHETLSIALNMIGASANTGEGGEEPARYRDERNAGIKQIASGRFGVTPAYVAHARELQIKMAQGSKPGEGGQLPGMKVTSEIARLRHTVPGVALISPPPHHDIYSIEDLAQLIFDLRQANPRAAVSVKLVASEGVGTIATGVVKALADVVHISGGDGGTGASPLSSIKNAGLPWEVGLAETQAALVINDLRARARVRVDGGIKTGRDIVTAALLGADEYSFGTAALVAEGCILVRTCHRDQCPVGIATQKPELRARFAGTPEMVARYLMLVAEEVRSLLGSLGLRSIQEAIGRTDLLRPKATQDPGAASLDLRALLVDTGEVPRRAESRPPVRVRSSLGDRLYRDAIAALGKGRFADLSYEIANADRAVGARLGCAVPYELNGRSRGRVRASFHGDAGQSFGAFLSDGIELSLTGSANDYVGKGMAGGHVAIRPPDDDAGDPYLAGNTVLYGATGGRLYIAGRVGERFAVRNSGAVAVVEGTGDHPCEYMTAGAVVILGPTGINLGAGMSGGEAYVLDADGKLVDRINPQLVGVYEPTSAQLSSLRRAIERHLRATGSTRARRVLDDWDHTVPVIRRVAPTAEVARLEALFEGTGAAAA